ncbi:carboxypeptidase regulatory-like domain-containing protein [Granulicella cerasi]|uniref:Carboxypeptidase regulatory-like domain-containing protein n=1 Tax=Granulicella cerasi TaxID=741063 RepID=A0ABW1ZA56_9BACT|nr:TonB-dependent receptor [Granulicella cerasi]
MSKRLTRYSTLFAAAAIVSASALGQALSGLSGTVTDPSKSVLPGAKITLKNNATGVVRMTKANGSGFYNFPSVEPGVYTLRVEDEGFQAYVLSNITLKAASSSGADVAMTLGSASESVSVNAASVMLDTTDASLGDNFNEKQIKELPINGRDYARLSLLTPGAVARSRYISDISFDGLHTVHNQFSIDGIDASRVDQPYMANGYERGARLLTGSLETIQEFRAQTSGYAAEYGRAAGSLVNIVTKTGTNKVHGEVYDFFRNEALDSRNYFAPKSSFPEKPVFRFNDFGGNISGPLVKDKTFYFFNYEGSRQTIGVIGSGSVLSDSARATALTNHPELAPILADMPIGNNGAISADLTASRYVSNTQVKENTGSVRIDHHFSQKDSIFGRFNLNDTSTFGPLAGVTTTALGINDHQNVPLRTTNFALGEQHMFNSHIINDALFGIQRWAATIESRENIPTVNISGVDAAVGSRGYSMGNNNSFQWGDSVTWVHGKHTIKFGGTIYRIQLNNKSVTNATISYANIQAFKDNTLQTATQSASQPGLGTRATQYGGYVQDSWQIIPTLTINYGIRYDFASNPHDKFFATRSFDPRTGDLMPAGHDYFQENYSNWSPRLGAAWAVTPRTVVKAAGGVFYQAYPVGFGQYYAPLNTLPGNYSLNQVNAPGLSYPIDSYIALGALTPTGYGFPSHKPDIFSEQWNLSVAQDFGHGTAVQASYVGNKGWNLWRQYNINLYVQNQTYRPNTKFGNVFLEGNNGSSLYNGMNLQLKQQMGKGLSFTGNYTWGHVIDDVQDQGLYSSDPQDVNNLKAERGNGSGDVRNNFSYSFLYSIPMGEGHSFLGNSNEIVKRLASGWNLNSLGILRSGVTSNVTMSGINSYGNLNYTNQRPNVVAGTSKYVAKGFTGTYINYLNRAAWTTPAAGTFGNSSRNTIYGPRFNQVDASLTKDTKITTTSTLQFRAEMFNILNHPNFGFPNVAWTPTSSTFGTISSTFGNTLGFGTARQVQFGLKYMF